MRSQKLFQVLFVAVLCTIVFAVVASAKGHGDGRETQGAKAPHQVVRP